MEDKLELRRRIVMLLSRLTSKLEAINLVNLLCKIMKCELEQDSINSAFIRMMFSHVPDGQCNLSASCEKRMLCSCITVLLFHFFFIRNLIKTRLFFLLHFFFGKLNFFDDLFDLLTATLMEFFCI